MATALETLFTETANSIRGGLPDVGKMSPSVFPEKIDEIVANGKNPALQEKTVTPTTSQQEVTPDAEYDGLSKVTVEAMQVSNTESPVIEVSDEGLVQASVQHNEGYVAAYEKTTSTKQLPTQAAKAVTPSANEQVAVEAGVFTTGVVTVAGDANLVPENIKSGVSIFGVDGTHEGGIDVTLIEGMEIALDFSAGDQSLSVPDGYAVKSATIEKPETLIPENIAKDVNVAGVVGTLESGGGEGGELVRYVTFLDEDGTQLFKMPVLVGDTCKDPVTHGDISTPTKESTNTQVFTHSGWTSTVGGTADADILKNITEDKTVYVAYAVSVRYYTVTFYDGATLLETVQVTYGGTATPAETPTKDDYMFGGWQPSNENITADTACYAQWTESAEFATASWATIAQIAESGQAQEVFSLGDEKEIDLGDSLGVVTVQIVGFNHDDLSDGSGKAAISVLCKGFPANYAHKYLKDGTSVTVSGVYGYWNYLKGKANEIKNYMPADLQAVIKPVKKYVDGDKNYISSNVDTIDNCFVWLPSLTEIGFLKSASSYYYQNLGTKYELFQTGENAKSGAKTPNPSGSGYWWTRSTYRGGKNTVTSVAYCGNLFGDSATTTMYEESLSMTQNARNFRFGFCI